MSDVKISGKLTSKIGDTQGIWLSPATEIAASDVHVLLENNSMVIGYNNNYETLKFTTIAVVLSEKEIYLQYAGKNGEVENKPIPPELMRDLLLKFLHEVKDKVVAS